MNGKGMATNLEAQISTLDGKPVGPVFSGSIDGDKGSLGTKISAPQLWTAETPNLYQVEVLLKEGSGVIHRYKQRFGFRTFEVREGDGLYLNGQRVVLKGCNRHSFWPDSGRCLSMAVHRLDVQTMKDMNMNAVRMSHYPPDAEFLDVCDELGMYVLDELAGWHWNYDNETGTKLVKEMVTRDVNHPSILFWDNGNEGGFNTNLDALFPSIDPQQRHVLHPWKLFGGVNTAHYQPYEKAKELCQGPDIYMPTEFNHGLYDGGAGAGLEDYWSLMQNSKVLGGGFIWAFLDEGVKRADTGQIDVSGNEAPDGIVGPYRQKEGSFYTIKELWAPLVIKQCGTPPTSLTVENHYSFTDANQCKFEWQLRTFRRPSEKSDGYKVMAHGVATVGSIAPGTNGTINLNLPSKWQRADALAVKASDPTGREIFTWVWPLPALEKSVAVPEERKSRNAPTLSETDDSLQIKTRDMTVAINKNSGFLTSVTKGKQTFSLGNGPRPAESEAQLVQLEHSVSGSDFIVKGKYSGALNSVTWRIRPDGWVQCDYAYNADGPKDFFGVAFDYPDSQVLSKKWLGVGPYRVWKNRQVGGTLNVWKNDYNNTVTGWADWIYPEFKGCFSDVRWLQLATTEGLITIVPEPTKVADDPALPFVQVLTPQFPPEKLMGKTGVSLPKAGLALLNAIPPVGSKFQAANLSGPQGQLTEAKGEYHGTVDFYFGKLP